MINGKVVAIISDRADAYVVQRGIALGIRTIVVRKRMLGADYDRVLLRRLKKIRPDLICLAGYLRILDSETVRTFAGRILNIHPSLLPRFGGKGMYGERVHRAVLESGEVMSGCTIHYVTDDVDGGPPVLQVSVPVERGDTVQSLSERVHAVELSAYPEAIRIVLERITVNHHLGRMDRV